MLILATLLLACLAVIIFLNPKKSMLHLNAAENIRKHDIRYDKGILTNSYNRKA